MSIAKNISLFIIALSIFISLRGHSQSQGYTFEELWEQALAENPEIKNARLEIDQNDRMRKTSWELGMTNFDYQRGQLNTQAVDNFYTFEQELGSPFEMSATNKFYRTREGLFLSQFEKIRREIKQQLRYRYYEWVFENERQKITEDMLNMYDQASEFAALQYETGESNLLSKALIESQKEELSLLLDQIKVNKSVLENRLQVIINSDEPVKPEDTELMKLPLIGADGENHVVADSLPEVALQNQRFKVASSFHRLTRSRLSPYFTAGYFKQEIDRVSGFDGWQVGIAFPLWFFPQKARIQAASIGMSIAENQYTFIRKSKETELENLMIKYDQLKSNLQFYEERQLDNASIIEENANLMYESGEINYLEFVQNMSAALEIRRTYLNRVNEYNRLIIDLYYYYDI